MTKVLVTDPEYKHSLAACRDLGKANVEVQVVGSSRAQARFSRYVSKGHTLPNSQAAFASHLAEVLENEGIDVILPIGAQTVFQLNQNRDLLAKFANFALAPSDSIQNAFDKSLMSDLGQSLGIPVPQSWSAETLDELEEVFRNTTGPLVVKSASELLKFGPVYVRDQAHASEMLAAGDFLAPLGHSKLLVQSRITGPGVGFFALYQNGVCKRAFMHERQRELPSTGGSSWAAKSIWNDDLLGHGLRLLDSLQWHGPAMVEFKMDKHSSIPYLMEVNPKFWGSLDLAIESGVHFPRDTVSVAMGEELRSDFRFKPDVLFVWPLDNPVGYCSDRALRKEKHSTNIRTNDLLPSLVQFLQSTFVALLTVMSRTLLMRLVYWARRYTFRQFSSRVIGELAGIPLRAHCRITDQLWIGARPKVFGLWMLRLRGIKRVISLQAENTTVPSRPGRINFRRFPTAEFLGVPREQLLDFVHLVSEGEGALFLHCREGVGRAPMFAAALLLSLIHI